MYYKHKPSYKIQTQTRDMVHYLKNKIVTIQLLQITSMHFIDEGTKPNNSYLSLTERLIDLLNSHDGHFDDKQPLKGDCRNNEDFDNCF